MFQVRYGLGGGFGGCEHNEWEDTSCDTEEQALNLARELCREDYDSYGSMHGLFDPDEYMGENPDATEEDVEIELEQDYDSWADYEVREV